MIFFRLMYFYSFHLMFSGKLNNIRCSQWTHYLAQAWHNWRSREPHLPARNRCYQTGRAHSIVCIQLVSSLFWNFPTLWSCACFLGRIVLCWRMYQHSHMLSRKALIWDLKEVGTRQRKVSIFFLVSVFNFLFCCFGEQVPICFLVL